MQINPLWTLLGTLMLLSIPPNTEAKQPNILFILVDDYGWQDVGYHGSEIRTPTLDKLASEGVKLENYYVQPICTPTRSTLLSGRYQIHTGLQHFNLLPQQRNGLPLNHPLVSDKLKELGYSTHMIGKWHVGFYKKEYTPTYRGFDSYLGYYTGMENYTNHIRCWKFTKEENFCGLDFHENEEPGWKYSGEYSTHLYTRKAEELVANHAKSNSDKPLFLYLPFEAVHVPLEVPEKYLKPYSFIKEPNRRTYAAMTSCMDEAVANVTEAFRKHGLWDNTVLVVSSDNGAQPFHGGGCNWPLRGGKNTMWEGGLRAVGFVHSPLLKTKGQISKELIHVSDWYPTLVNLAGGTTAGLELDGYDVWDTISKGSKSPRKEILHFMDPMWPALLKPLYNNTFNTSVRAAIRIGDWKLITGDPGGGGWYPPPNATTLFYTPQKPPKPKKNIALFNIKEDPTEKNELSVKHPDIVWNLLQRLQYYNSTAVPIRFPPLDPKSNPKLHGGVWSPWVEGDEDEGSDEAVEGGVIPEIVMNEEHWEQDYVVEIMDDET